MLRINSLSLPCGCGVGTGFNPGVGVSPGMCVGGLSVEPGNGVCFPWGDVQSGTLQQASLGETTMVQ